MVRILHRSRNDRMLFGVCGGLAAHWGVDPTVVRAGAVLLAWVTGGAAVLAYLVMLILVPEEPAGGGESAVAYPNREETVMNDETSEPPNEVPGGGPVQEAGWATGQTPAPVQEPVYVAPPQYAPPTYEAPPEKKKSRAGITGGLVLVALGLVFLAGEFIPGFDPGRLWPLILVAIGVGIILKKR
jgi:phage shock protein C